MYLHDSELRDFLYLYHERVFDLFVMPGLEEGKTFSNVNNLKF